MSKFSKLAKLVGGSFGENKITKFDIDVIYKKMTSLHEKIDINAFYESIDLLLKKSFKPDSKLTMADRLDKLINRFEKIKSIDGKKAAKGAPSRGVRRAQTTFGGARAVKKEVRKFEPNRERIIKARSKSRGYRSKKYTSGGRRMKYGGGRSDAVPGYGGVLEGSEKLPKIKNGSSARLRRPQTRI